VFRLRRVILKLTVALAAIPLGFLVIFLPTVGMALGSCGHQIGSHYVIRYIDEYHTLDVYRNSYPWFSLGLPDFAPLLMQYGLICVAVASVETFIRFLERRNRSRKGFEILMRCPAPPSGDAPRLPR
jgi:hypothetical protein